jgi:ATP-binding cassette subfamily B protein
MLTSFNKYIQALNSTDREIFAYSLSEFSVETIKRLNVKDIEGSVEEVEKSDTFFISHLVDDFLNFFLIILRTKLGSNGFDIIFNSTKKLETLSDFYSTELGVSIIRDVLTATRTEDEIIEAAKKSNSYDFIMNFPDKFNTNVGERGVSLSGGQKQRIAIARAILKDAKILILDEATASLDSHTENQIQESLNLLIDEANSKSKKTIIAIAHRLSTLKHMDRIIVLEQGKIIEDGTHEQLIKAKGYYHMMWSMQAGGFLPEVIENNAKSYF